MLNVSSTSQDGILAGLTARDPSGLSIAALVVLSLLAYTLYLVYDVYWGPMSGFPGPIWNKMSGIPHAWVQCRGREMEAIPALHAKYGDVVQVAPRELSVASGARGWAELYGFRKPGQPKLAKDPIMYFGPVITADHVNSIGDAAHSRHRRILSHAFSDAALREQEPLMRCWAVNMRDSLEDKIGDAAEAVLDVNKMLQCVSFDLMAELTFGESLGVLKDGHFNPWLVAVVDGIRLDAWLRIARHFALGRVLANTILDNKIARRIHWKHMKYCRDRVDRRLSRTPERPDFWSRILANSEKQGGQLARQEQYNNATIFMLAGTETTSTWLSGTLYYLIKHPEWMDKVQKEVRAAFSSVHEMSLERLIALKVMNACLQETFRIYPPIPCALLRRTPPGGVPVLGTWIPGDVTIGMHGCANNLSDKHFKSPHEYHPERWLGDPEYAGDELAAVEPFSVGPRNCLGKYLAWHEGRLLLATLMLHFDFELAKGSEDWMADQVVYTLWTKGPMVCRVRRAGTA